MRKEDAADGATLVNQRCREDEGMTQNTVD